MMDVKKVISIMAIMPGNLFFMVLAMLGFEYQGKEGSSFYIIYCFFVAIAMVGIFIKEFWRKQIQINREIRMLIGIIFLIIIQGLSFSIIRENNLFSSESFRFFVLWTIPSICSGIYMANNYNTEKLMEIMKIVMLIITIAIIRSVIIPFFMGVKFEEVGGATYQTAGYMSALAYGMNLYYRNCRRKKNCNKKAYSYFKKIIYDILMIMQILALLISGARGAAILAVVYTVVNILIELKKGNLIKNLRLILMSIMLIVTIGLVLPRLMQNEMIGDGINRIFQFVGDDGIDWSKGTSGRDVVYRNGINMFLENPLFGNGIFKREIYYHNIFLDIAAQTGIIGMGISIIYIYIFSKKFKKLICIDYHNLGILSIGLFPVVMLIFSGRYIYTSEFWFVIAFICASNMGVNKRRDEDSTCAPILQ